MGYRSMGKIPLENGCVYLNQPNWNNEVVMRNPRWVRPRPDLNSKVCVFIFVSGGTEPGFEKDEVGKATFGYFNFSPEAPLTKAPQVTIILDQVKSECDASFFENIDSNGQQVFICIRAVMGGDTISLSDSSIDDEDLPTINQQFLDRLSEMPTSRQVFMRFGLIGKTMEENESMFTESDARSFRDSYNTLEIKENEM
ncbi:hypothetical protein L2E82_30804 [Cichorium intybus]|uniref:Uncharacterized protein n=1 Tax=Cichorium intybus TaxID=13427 RepID=A0ACB9D1M4_CICIN|nr:hypothetical protein L2E82_51135 [Cichorium intybus]KAI3740376.1 hypothetical protein L2E82_30804 [Cichorium intybus]